MTYGCRGFPRVRGDVPYCLEVPSHKRQFSPRARGCSGFGGFRDPFPLVFPACAGMFLGGQRGNGQLGGFPRVRGDVPLVCWGHLRHERFSPRARGCSGRGFIQLTGRNVFPACAGMFPQLMRSHSRITSFPRVRGDVPLSKVALTPDYEFSPRARGCSPAEAHEIGGVKVFPACAGMFPVVATPPTRAISFPRVRGDVPFGSTRVTEFTLFSPRARGCSAAQRLRESLTTVFPACAGMFPVLRRQLCKVCSFPRVRGDVPICLPPYLRNFWFSPRARGCSALIRGGLPTLQVFPACAGMFLVTPVSVMITLCFPRVRGDVPRRSSMTSCLSRFSPRARGCSPYWQARVCFNPVFPACAGMFPLENPSGIRRKSFPRVRGDVPKTLTCPHSRRWFSPRARGCSSSEH